MNATPEAGCRRMTSPEDDLFATRFEMHVLAQAQANRGTVERWVDGFVPEGTSLAHRARYDLAARFVENRQVLDIACGAGKGTRMLAEMGNARKVFGVDIDAEAIRYARIRNAVDRCFFCQSSIEDWNDQTKHDVVVSFETIEHLARPDVLLAKVHESMEPRSQFLISTPISHVASQIPKNKFHKQEWTEKDFRELLLMYGFDIEQGWYQGLRGFSTNPLDRIKRKIYTKEFSKAIQRLGQGEIFDSKTPYRRFGAYPKFQIYRLRTKG